MFSYHAWNLDLDVYHIRFSSLKRQTCGAITFSVMNSPLNKYQSIFTSLPVLVHQFYCQNSIFIGCFGAVYVNRLIKIDKFVELSSLVWISMLSSTTFSLTSSLSTQAAQQYLKLVLLRHHINNSSRPGWYQDSRLEGGCCELLK